MNDDDLRRLREEREPAGPFDRLLLKWLGHDCMVEQAQVDGNAELVQRAKAWVWVKFAILISLLAALVFQEFGEPLFTLAMFVLTVIVSIWCMETMRRQVAYSRGWHEGRQLALNAFREAERRGHSPREWFDAEIERSANSLP